MNRVEACNSMIEGVSEAKEMEHMVFDEKAGTFKVVKEEIPEGVQGLAVQCLKDLSDGSFDYFTIFHGQDDAMDYTWYLKHSEGDVELVLETDSGMKHHTYYNSPEQMLYGISQMLKAKKFLKPVDVARKK